MSPQKCLNNYIVTTIIYHILHFKHFVSVDVIKKNVFRNVTQLWFLFVTEDKNNCLNTMYVYTKIPKCQYFKSYFTWYMNLYK